MSVESKTYIIIDCGNTYVKLSIFDNDRTSLRKKFGVRRLKALKNFLETCHPGSQCIISSVIDLPDYLMNTLHSRFETVVLSHDTPVPLKNLYHTPATLGKDRIAAAVAGRSLCTTSDVLVIDAGTAITIDLVTQKGEYCGGSITPGLVMRFRALHQFTKHLPLIKVRNIRFLNGLSTHESILSGVVNGVSAELDGMIDRYREKYPGIKIVLGGGDAKLLHKRLKNSIFALPNLTEIGLFKILMYNIEKKAVK